MPDQQLKEARDDVYLAVGKLDIQLSHYQELIENLIEGRLAEMSISKKVIIASTLLKIQTLGPSPPQPPRKVTEYAESAQEEEPL